MCLFFSNCLNCSVAYFKKAAPWCESISHRALHVWLFFYSTTTTHFIWMFTCKQWKSSISEHKNAFCVNGPSGCWKTRDTESKMEVSISVCLKLNFLTWVPRFYIALYVHICICIMCEMKNTQDANSMFKHVHLTRSHKNNFWVGVDNFVGSAPTFSANVLRASRVRIQTLGTLLIPPLYLSPRWGRIHENLLEK